MTHINFDISAALDYLDAAMNGLPAFTATVADAYGHERIARGQCALLLILIAGAAKESGATPHEIIQRMRENYGGITA